jgi:hypothetical protein
LLKSWTSLSSLVNTRANSRWPFCADTAAC